MHRKSNMTISLMTAKPLDPFETRLLEQLLDPQFWPQEQALFLLAYSGGPDSQALLQALLRLQKESEVAVLTKAEFVVCHFEHGWRPESAAQDEAFCRAAAADWSLPYEYSDVDQLKEKLGNAALPENALGETAARHYRRAFLYNLQKAYTDQRKLPVYLVFAHQHDDRVETLLMNLFRGAGIEGLTAMPKRRGLVLRPLLEFSKKEILAYLRRNALPSLKDPSNEEGFTTRNRLRLKLMPLLEVLFEQPGEHLLNSVAQLEQIKEALLYPAVERALESVNPQRLVFTDMFGSRMLGVSLEKNKLLNQPEVLRAFLWRRILCDTLGELRDLGSAHYALLERKVTATSSGAQAFIDSSILSYDRYEMRLWYKNSLPIEKAGFVSLLGPKQEQKILFFGETQSDTERFSLFEKAERMSYNFLTWFAHFAVIKDGIWRSRREGDYIRLKNGQSKSLKKFMSEQRVPHELRDCCLVFCRESEVLWLPSYFIRKEME